MYNSTTKHALVTGGSRGIGKALAYELAQKGYSLLLIANNASVLQATAEELQSAFPHITVEYLAVDLSDRGAIEQVKAWTLPYHDTLEVVINNAGYGLSGSFAEKDLEVQLDMIDVNFRVLVALSYIYLPILQRRRKAYLLNVASTAAYQSVPYLSVYAATKAAVLSFTRGLRRELRNGPVVVSCLSPGSTDTHFADRAEMGPDIKKIAEKFNMSPEAVASKGIEGLFAGRAEIIPGFTNQLGTLLPRWVPKAWTEKIASDIYEPKIVS